MPETTQVGTHIFPIDVDDDEDDVAPTSFPPAHQAPLLKQPASSISEPFEELNQMLMDEEDVCFICFDGGDLVLCDRKSCPKAYHIQCTGRGDKYFNGKEPWYCGWHICGVCGKSAVKQCYTCPAAFCDSCCDEAEFLAIRKGKGLCENCFMLVSMIEQDLTTNLEGCEVDFADEETYECLFKSYWTDVKKSNELTWIEIVQASQKQADNKPLMNVDEESAQNGGDDGCQQQHKRQSQHLKKRRKIRNSVSTDTSDSEFHHVEAQEKENEMVEEEEEEVGKEEELEKEEECDVDNNDMKFKRNQNKVYRFKNWASKKLVKFLDDIGEDSKLPLSLVMVMKLLWGYIEKNRLVCTPTKCKVTCDEKLYGLFQKKYVSKHEMMKLLSCHVASKKRGAKKLNTSGEGDDNVVVGLDDKLHKHKKAKKELDDVEKPKPDQSDYAAIDVSNINLIYLKRSSFDALREDPNFESKVLGSFVRIRVPAMGNKYETFYRLVQVIGIKKAKETTNTTKMAGIILEVLNLQNHEEVNLDAISNNDFTEEECQRLQHSIKNGFLKAMTVGQLKEKALALQEARVKDWIKNELLRLGNLRDRASEKGHKKELREYVEKIQVLSSSAEQERQLKAPILINVEPHASSEYDSYNVKDVSALSTGSENHMPISIQKSREKVTFIDGALSMDEAAVNLNNVKNLSTMDDGWGNVGGEGSWSNLAGDDTKTSEGRSQKGDVWRSNTSKAADGYGDGRDFDVKKRNTYSENNYGQSAKNDILHKREGDPNTSDPVAVDFNGKEKMWYYKDPTGKVQGPFSMEQLRRWEKTNLFPADLRVWRTTNSQDGGMYLKDALFGRRDKVFPHGFVQPGDPRANNFVGMDYGVSDPDKVFEDEEADNIKRSGCYYSTHDASGWGSKLENRLPCDGQDRSRHGKWGQGKVSCHPKHSDVLGNAGRFPTSKKDCPCRYFAKGMCMKGQHCEFKH